MQSTPSTKRRLSRFLSLPAALSLLAACSDQPADQADKTELAPEASAKVASAVTENSAVTDDRNNAAQNGADASVAEKADDREDPAQKAAEAATKAPPQATATPATAAKTASGDTPPPPAARAAETPAPKAASATAKPPAAFMTCRSCHSVEPGKHGIGPSLHGVFGRQAAAVDGFNYSPALAQSGINWSRAALDKYLDAPVKMVPGTRMVVGVPNAGQRAAVIDYLETLK